jgi:probable addiction module antidote protein
MTIFSVYSLWYTIKMLKKQEQKPYRQFSSYLAEELKSKKHAKAILEGAFDDYKQTGNLEDFLTILRIIAEARGGLGELSKKTKTSRQNIYKVLSKGGNPTLITLEDILKNLGFKLSIEAI